MVSKSLMILVAAVAASLLATLPLSPASAWSTGSGSGPSCKHGGGKGGSTIIINKPISIYKPVTINNDININKNININNNVNINKNININKNVNINNNVNINKNIVIDNSSATATAEASAQSAAQALAGSRASAGATGNTYGGSYVGDTIINKSGEMGTIGVSQGCEMQVATVVKAVHAICVSADGHEFPASHMQAETFIESSYEGEIARCIPGATVKVVIGDVVQSDQGMAGSYAGGQVLACGPHEALRHFKDGMLKCAPEVPVKDCTERTNLRRYGTGDMFFSYRTQVCISGSHTANKSPVELNGMTLEGGVGD
jgi:hypothetical protein